MRKFKSWMRFINTFLLSYLLFILLVLLITGIVLLQTVFSPSYMARRADNSGFADAVMEELSVIYISNARASGVPESVILPLLTVRHIDSAVKAQIRSAYGVSIPYDYANYENEIYDALYAYAAGLGIEPEDIPETGLRDLAELCVEDFKKQIALPVIDTAGTTLSRYSRIFTVITALVTGAALLTALLINVVNRRISCSISGYIYSTGAAALVCCAIPVTVYSSGFTGNLNIMPRSFNILLASWIDGIARGYLIALIPLIMILASLIALWIYRRGRRIRLVKKYR